MPAPGARLAASVTRAACRRAAAPHLAASSWPSAADSTSRQGLTVVHFSAQLERFVWDRGCMLGLCSPS